MSAVHARIPMVMPDEVRALQIENAETLEQQWSALQAISEEKLAGHKATATKLKQTIADDETAAAKAGSQAARAKDRITRLKAGENIAGIDKPLDLIREFGFTARQVRHMLLLAELGDKGLEEYLREIEKRHEAWEQAVARDVARRHRR